MSSRSLFTSGGTPSFVFGSPAPGDDTKSLIFVEASQSTTFGVPPLSTHAATADSATTADSAAFATNATNATNSTRTGSFVTGGTLQFAPATGGGVFDPATLEYTVSPIGDGTYAVLRGICGGATTTTPLDSTPTKLDAQLPVEFPTTVASGTYIGFTIVTVGAAVTPVSMAMALDKIQFAKIDGTAFANDNVTIHPFEFSYVATPT